MIYNKKTKTDSFYGNWQLPLPLPLNKKKYGTRQHLFIFYLHLPSLLSSPRRTVLVSFSLQFPSHTTSTPAHPIPCYAALSGLASTHRRPMPNRNLFLFLRFAKQQIDTSAVHLLRFCIPHPIPSHLSSSLISSRLVSNRVVMYVQRKKERKKNGADYIKSAKIRSPVTPLLSISIQAGFPFRMAGRRRRRPGARTQEWELGYHHHTWRHLCYSIMPMTSF